jgi:opacity protein-like surface antigen
MKYLGNAAIAVVVGGFAASPALAADLPRPPEVAPAAVFAPAPAPVDDRFAGPYFGVFGGYVWMDKDWYWPQFLTEIHQTAVGWLAGAEVGFRVRNGNFVFGGEADWAWTNATGLTDDCPNILFYCETDVHWLATVTAQAGFAVGPLLLYGETGVAFASETFTADGDLVNHWEYSLVNPGFVAGGGIVLGANNGIYVKAEYNFINFGVAAFTWTDGVYQEDLEITQTAHVLKIGLGFGF